MKPITNNSVPMNRQTAKWIANSDGRQGYASQTKMLRPSWARILLLPLQSVLSVQNVMTSWECTYTLPFTIGNSNRSALPLQVRTYSQLKAAKLESGYRHTLTFWQNFTGLVYLEVRLYHGNGVHAQRQVNGWVFLFSHNVMWDFFLRS